MDSYQSSQSPRESTIVQINPIYRMESSGPSSQRIPFTRIRVSNSIQTNRFTSSNHSNPIHSIHFLISSFLNAHQIPRQFHVSTFQACNSLQSCYSYRFPIGSWNDYSMEYFRTLPNSSAYVTDSCPSDSFSRRTVCLV